MCADSHTSQAESFSQSPEPATEYAERSGRASSTVRDGCATEEERIPERIVDDLEALCSADMQDWMARLMPEDSVGMFVASICVDPRYQGSGYRPCSAGVWSSPGGFRAAECLGAFVRRWTEDVCEQ